MGFLSSGGADNILLALNDQDRAIKGFQFGGTVKILFAEIIPHELVDGTVALGETLSDDRIILWIHHIGRSEVFASLKPGIMICSTGGDLALPIID